MPAMAPPDRLGEPPLDGAAVTVIVPASWPEETTVEITMTVVPAGVVLLALLGKKAEAGELDAGDGTAWACVLDSAPKLIAGPSMSVEAATCNVSAALVEFAAAERVWTPILACDSSRVLVLVLVLAGAANVASMPDAAIVASMPDSTCVPLLELDEVDDVVLSPATVRTRSITLAVDMVLGQM